MGNSELDGHVLEVGIYCEITLEKILEKSRFRSKLNSVPCFIKQSQNGSIFKIKQHVRVVIEKSS